MIYQISNGIVAFGADTILDKFNFEIKNKKQKIAIVGRNGCGKTTLLKTIAGEIELTKEDGLNSSIAMTGNPSIGYLKQLTFEDNNRTLDEEIRHIFERIISMKNRLDEMVKQLENNHDEKLINDYTRLQEEFQDLGGYYYEKEYDVMLKSFGFCMEDKNKKLSEFSGGQRTKLAFIKLLLSKPDILLLDEPTNHLDIATIQWLEGYLQNYPRAVVVVSHDRMFLDKIVDTVYEIERHRVTRYNGNYTAFMKQKKENYDKQLKDHVAQQKEIDRLNQIAERFKNKPTKVSMARSKLKAIEHMDIIDAPENYDDKAFRADYTPRLESGKDVLNVMNLAIGYNSVLSQVSFDIKKNDRLGIIGGNGLGKSTLLKTIVGAIEPLGGSYKYGVNVEIGYFDQQMAQYTSDKTIIEDFWDEFPNLTQTEVRNALGGFLFTQEDVFKDVSLLSGGEKVRLALCKIFQRKPNLLILDEPTNHMDIVGKEALEDMLVEFKGTLVFVSHDRYFVNKVAKEVLLMEENQVKLYSFGYSQYEEEQEKKRESLGNDYAMGGRKISSDVTSLMGSASSSSAPGNSVQENGASGNSSSGKEVSTTVSAAESYQAGKEASRIARKIKKLEDEMAEIEELIENKKAELNAPENASDYEKLASIQSEIDEAEEKLLIVMEEWESLS